MLVPRTRLTRTLGLLALPLLVALGPLDPDKLRALNPAIGWGIVVLARWKGAVR